MEIKHGALAFCVKDGRVTLDSAWNLSDCGVLPVFDLAGGNASGLDHYNYSALTDGLRYVSHTVVGDTLTIVQESGDAKISSQYEIYGDTNAVRITQTIENTGDTNMTVEALVGFTLRFGDFSENSDWYFHRFMGTRYVESMPVVGSLYDLGMYHPNSAYSIRNMANASCVEAVPQAVVEHRPSGDCYFASIESYSAWMMDLTVVDEKFHLALSGANGHDFPWCRKLQPGETYTAPSVAVCFGHGVNDALANMTRYRRHIACLAEKSHVIYNEYMHFSWDDPNEARTLATAPFVKQAGGEYYIIDCGWHNAPEFSETDLMYRQFGTWKEDRARFPRGIKFVADELAKLGLKFGMWVSPEVVGVDNHEMIEYYGDECFLHRNGAKIRNRTGYLVDFRTQKVRDYMTETIDRMILEYGCQYIKFDWSPNPGVGVDGESMGAGLEDHCRAFTDWAREMTERHPTVLFEDCAGGGARTDYKALSIFHLLSTSDQISYRAYPYIATNVMMSALPEQAGVWVYPAAYEPTLETVRMNMANAMLSEVHLASDLSKLDDTLMREVQEGLSCHQNLADWKKSAVPFLPLGYARAKDSTVAVGLTDGEVSYLTVWHFGKASRVEVPVMGTACTRYYPIKDDISYSLENGVLSIDFPEGEYARVFEIR